MLRLSLEIMYQRLKNLYERYHQKTRLQKRVIGRKNFTYRLILDILTPYLRRKEKVLDVGCGAGTLSFYMAKKGNWVFGIDISPKAIEMCQQTARVLDLEKNTVFKVANFPGVKIDEKFDLILCIEVLEHLLYDKKAILEIFKLLVSRGILVISVPSENAPLYRLGIAREFDRKVGHLRRYSRERIVRILLESGFRIREIKETEGIVRNFLFLNKIAERLIRILNRVGFLSDLVTSLDNLTIPIFGKSNILIVAQKP